MPASGPHFVYSQISATLLEFLSRYGFGEDCDIALAGTAGSRRYYWRLRQGLRSLILLQSPSDDADFGRFLRITQFYRLMRFPVPMVYCIDDAEHQVLLEDLGERRLYDWVVQSRAEGTAAMAPDILDAYRQAIDLLIDLQTRCQAMHQECPDIRSRIFGKDQLLWETAYYRAQYLEGHRGLPAETAAALQPLFDELAAAVDTQPKAVMHRDYQSQNLMAPKNGTLQVIDYQGSRLGSIYYDLASLLLDPYVGLDDVSLGELLRYYHTRSLHTASFEAMQRSFLLAGMQRIMQALGAYCFLSRVKGLADFAAHIAPGEARLRWLIKRSGEAKWEALMPG